MASNDWMQALHGNDYSAVMTGHEKQVRPVEDVTKRCALRGHQEMGMGDFPDPGKETIVDDICDCPKGVQVIHASGTYDDLPNPFGNGFPSCLSKFRGLEQLGARFDGMHDLAGVDAIRGVKALDISYNDLGSLSGIGTLDGIQKLDVTIASWDGADELPGSLEDLSIVTDAVGPIPEAIGNLKRLEELNIMSPNPFDGIGNLATLPVLESMLLTPRAGQEHLLKKVDLGAFSGFDALKKLTLNFAGSSKNSISITNASALPRELDEFTAFGISSRSCAGIKASLVTRRPHVDVFC